MAEKSRLDQKNDMYILLGRLFSQLFEIKEHPDRFDSQERAEAVAKFLHDRDFALSEFRRFTLAQPGHNYLNQLQNFVVALDTLRDQIQRGHEIEQVVGHQFELARIAIDEIPIPRESMVLEAGSPFTAYIKLRELFAVEAIFSLTLIDAYLSDDVFVRYLKHVRPECAITILTEQGTGGKKYIDRWNGFLNVSRLFATERGPQKYKLLVATSLHDRSVNFDGKRFYSLGGSLKDAGGIDYFTITASTPDPQILTAITQQIASASEWFGPNQTTHQ